MDLSLVTAAVVRRFQERVRRGSPDECWPWAGTITVKGYGQISDHGTPIRAHRLAHYLATGEQPECVCHRCDNPPCCNPAHLFGGSPADNQGDKKRKGRSARGEANAGGGKLTEADVRAIRDALATGAETQVAIGARFGVSGVEVGYIASRKHWAHVA